MERIKNNQNEVTVISPNEKEAVTFPGIMVTATLAASLVSPYGMANQYQIPRQDAKVSTSQQKTFSHVMLNRDPLGYEKTNILEAEMSSISREELDAKLALSKSEMDLNQTRNFSSIEKLLLEVKGEISSLRGDMGSLRGELSGNKDAVAGQIDGLKSSISTMQWMVGTVLAMIGIAVAILAIPGIDKLI